jgi:dTDP-4-dehydrorhamnose reductase
MMILIVGAGGRVGRLLEKGLQERFPDRVVAATREELDLTDPARVAMEIERLDPAPTAVINCAALVDPGGAEEDPEAYLATDRDGVGTLGRAGRERGCRLVHLSTVDVFQGNGPAAHREDDAPDSRSAYGRIRRLGEIAATTDPASLVLRLSVVVGDGDERDPLESIRRAVERGEPLAWEDRRISPIFPGDLTAAVCALIASSARGVFHLGNSGSCLLSELVEEAARLLGADAPALVGGPGPASFWARSGPNASLEIRRYVDQTGRRPREWREALRAVLRPE